MTDRVAARPPGLLLTLWVALISADRLDLLGGAASFSLTPFLVLTPLLVLRLLFDAMQQRRRVLGLTRATVVYLSLACALIVVAGASVFVSPDTALSAQRTVLMAAQLLGALAVVALHPELRERPALMLPGVALGVSCFLFCNVLQALAFLGRIGETLTIGPVVLHTVASQYAGLVPRFSGSSFDPNRGGILLVFYLAVLLLTPSTSRRRGGWIALVVVLLVSTLSRSAMLAAGVLVAGSVLQRRQVRIRPSVLLGAVLSLGLAGVFLLGSARARAAVTRAVAPFTQRFSIDEGSTQGHLALLQRGIADATSSLPTLAIGRGFGSSYVFLQDLFPGTRYGNYHSLYVSMFAESGIVALALTLMLALVPAASAGPYRPLVAALALFNVFYQLTTEPLFWAILALGWSTLVIRNSSRRTQA